MSNSNIERDNEQLLGYYVGVGEELALYFDELKTEFYLEYTAAPNGFWELYRGKNGIQATQIFHTKLEEIHQRVTEEYQHIQPTKKICSKNQT